MWSLGCLGQKTKTKRKSKKNTIKRQGNKFIYISYSTLKFQFFYTMHFISHPQDENFPDIKCCIHTGSVLAELYSSKLKRIQKLDFAFENT